MERTNSYKKTEVGVIPEDWEVKRLGEVTNRIGDSIHATPRYSKNGDYYFINGNNLKNGLIEIDDFQKRIDYEEYMKFKQELTKNCILLSINGTIGNCSYYKGEKVLLGKSVCYLNLNRAINTQFAFYSIQFSKVQKQFIQELTGTTIKNLSLKAIRETAIFLPPLQEQKAIAKVLSDVDELITSIEELIDKKQKIKQGTMQLLLTGKKRLPGFTGEWEVRSIGDIADVGRGRVISQTEINSSLNQKYPVYSSQTTNSGIMGYIDAYDFEGEYVTWTTDGVNAGRVFYRKGRFNCTNVCGTIKLKKDDHSFVASILNTLTSKFVSKNLANPKLMNNVMKKIQIPLPPLPEQKAIAQILSDMDLEIEALGEKLEKYKLIKDGMMEQLLTGKVRLI